MRVIPPVALLDTMTLSEAQLTSSTAAEPGVNEAAYNAGTTYGVGDEVILGSPTSTVTITIAAPAVVSWATHGQAEWTPVVFTTTGALPTGITAGTLYYIGANPAAGTFNISATIGGAPITTTGSQSGTHTATTQVHRRYESLVASNTGNYPTLAANVGVKWLDIGPTNRWAALDLLRNTPTITASPLTMVITPGKRVNSIALLGVVATSAVITVTSVGGGGTVYNSGTIALNTRIVLNWYDYFFAPFSTAPSVVKFDLPPYTDAIITVTLTNTGGNVECGSCVIGTFVDLGYAQYNAVSDVDNYSVITVDAYGNTTTTPRRSVPKVSIKTYIAHTAVDALRVWRELLNARPAVWSGLDDVTDPWANALLILGIYRTFSINVDWPTWAVINFEIREI